MGVPGRGFRGWESIVALGAGLALGWSFVDYGSWWMPWIAVAPLIAIAETRALRRAFLLGWLGGAAGIACAFVWLIHTFQVFGGFTLPVALALFVPPVAWMGVQIGVFTGALAWLGPLPFALGAPLTYAVVEFLFPTLFPWRLAHTQYRLTSLLQSGEIAGPYLLGFVMVWCNAGLVHLLRLRRIAPLAAALGALAILVMGGEARERHIDTLRSTTPLIRVGIVQGNIGVERKGDRAFFRRNLDEYRRLSWQIADDVALLVWPETVAQHPLRRDERLPAPDDHPFGNTPRPLIFGGLAIDDGPAGSRLYNSAFVTESGGTITGRYDKRILMPFGEYLPLASRFPWLQRLSPASGHFTPGEAATLLTTGAIRAGPLICYEDIVPDPARRAVRQGANLLVNLTNDAWYGLSAEPFQHQALALWRAIETRRDFIRATNTGLSAAITASGVVVAELPLFTAEARVIDVRLLEVQTFYATWGDVFAWSLVACWLALAWRRRRTAFA
ncbi:MAG: apolipoprotein N-acyltransferase [Myxococcales bacterium]|jgi:apolipoprotein N-acyltransferase|nr:apolipoprotein N-acyltransferase [Myxococcales bacterium]